MSENTERTMAPAVPPGAAPAQRTARQRRPTGAPPPLPHPFRVTTTAWLLLAVAIVTCAFLFSQHTAWLRLDDRANTWLLRRLAFDRPASPGDRFASLNFYTFPGGCVSYQLRFTPGASSLLATGVRSAVAFMPRVTVVDYVRDKESLALCGRGATCPG